MKPKWKEALVGVLLICVVFVLTTIAIYYAFPVRNHWAEIYRPAALRIIRGENPYVGLNYFNPPWALIPLIPLAILPIRVGNAILGAITLFSFFYIALRLGAKVVTLLFLFTLPFTLYNVIQVNVDWLVVWGFILPPQIGLFFILLKPQLGIFLAFYWLIDSWKQGGVKLVIKTFSPVMISFLLSFLFYGNYLEKGRVAFHDATLTFWPASISIGLVIMVLAFRWKKPGLAIFVAPLLSPYVQPYSLPLAVYGLLPDQSLTVTFILGLWFIFINPSRQYVIQRLLEPFTQ